MLPLVFLATVLPAPSAQPTLANVLRDVIGDCRTPADGAVLVCAKREGESPFRLAPAERDTGFDVNGPIDSVSRERHRWMEVGETGSGSCGDVGAGGWTGCMVKGWNAADQQRGFRPAGRFKK
jgi:hypothetical protein